MHLSHWDLPVSASQGVQHSYSALLFPDQQQLQVPLHDVSHVTPKSQT